ncbi:ABH_G0023330.mRNA.1.CDS.1 [Saccharomyces cerevisiae]|nr:ABH_G0023330.mRNA.1.CDS.1 [Saccharomyces cerevisiae]CAI6663819.1 ABH_G0023330.mRNA.1.CDS.1 [Saccharomyces cerevisiae]
MAIDYYLIHLSSDKEAVRQLLGPEGDFKTPDFLNEVCEVFFPLIGVKPYNATEFKVAERMSTPLFRFTRKVKETAIPCL